MARTGKKRMKVTGTVPEDLGKWVQDRIDSGEFHNQSHVLTNALKQFRESRESKGKGSAETPSPPRSRAA